MVFLTSTSWHSTILISPMRRQQQNTGFWSSLRIKQSAKRVERKGAIIRGQKWENKSSRWTKKYTRGKGILQDWFYCCALCLNPHAGVLTSGLSEQKHCRLSKIQWNQQKSEISNVDFEVILLNALNRFTWRWPNLLHLRFIRVGKDFRQSDNTTCTLELTNHTHRGIKTLATKMTSIHVPYQVATRKQPF